jgi:hypothetical protein
MSKQLLQTTGWTGVAAGAFVLVYAFWDVFYAEPTLLDTFLAGRKTGGLGFHPSAFDKPGWAVFGIALLGLGVGLLRASRSASPSKPTH